MKGSNEGIIPITKNAVKYASDLWEIVRVFGDGDYKRLTEMVALVTEPPEKTDRIMGFIMALRAAKGS